MLPGFLTGCCQCDGIQRRLFVWMQPAPVAAWQISKLHGPNADPHQVSHWVPQLLSNTADLTISTFA